MSIEDSYALSAPDSADGPEAAEFLSKLMNYPVDDESISDADLLQSFKAQQDFLLKLLERSDDLQRRADEKKETIKEQQEHLRRLEVMRHEMASKAMEVNERSHDRTMRARDTEIRRSVVEKLCDTALQYGSQHKGERYTHMAIKNITQSVAQIMGSEPVGNLPKAPELPKAKSTTDPLEERIKKAQEQGFRWNDHNKRPKRESTVIAKLTAWENDFKKGSETPPEALVSRPYDDLEGEYGTAFLAGFTEALEASTGTPPLSPYLKVRFTNLVEKYTTGDVNIIDVKVIDDNEYHAKKLTSLVFGPGIGDSSFTEAQKIILSRIESVGGVKNLTVPLLRKTCTLSRLPIFFEWDPADADSTTRLASLKRGKYDSEYEKLLSKYVSQS